MVHMLLGSVGMRIGGQTPAPPLGVPTLQGMLMGSNPVKGVPDEATRREQLRQYFRQIRGQR